MTYLITGATGFIGRHLVTYLLEKGHSVIYLARKQSPQIDSRAAFFAWQPGVSPPLDCMGRLDAIVHLAGEPVAQRWTAATRKLIWDSRVDLTRLLVEAIACLRNKPEVLVSASAIGIYGDRGDEVLTERSPPSSDFLADLCIQWEKEAVRASEFGVRVTPIRIAVVLGRGGGALKPMLPAFRAGLGGRLGSGSQWMSWIYLGDLIRLLEFAATTKTPAGVLNGSAPEPVRNVDFAQTLGRLLDRPALLPAPRFALRLALGPVADHILASARVVPESAIRNGFTFEYPTVEAALRACLISGA